LKLGTNKMTIGYLEATTGIAGDMFLGALLDAGVPLAYLQSHLTRLGINQEYQLQTQTVKHQGQVATKAKVILSHPSNHPRHLPEIQTLITQAQLPLQAETRSLEVFATLAQAEAEVHGIPPEQVHFHEVGAVDAIIDIVGTCLGLDWLGITALVCSPLPTGGGTVKAAHGELPVPVPAVLKLWERYHVPVYSNGIAKELVTPTGAALACTLASSFGAPPQMRLQRVGLGAGTRKLPLPNILRLWVGESCESEETLERVAVLETQIDDATPQTIAYTLEALLGVGALDVFTQGIGMKKSRLGTLLTVICPLDKVRACEMVIFAETTTLGIRRTDQQRSVLQREIQELDTPYGQVRVKVASLSQSGLAQQDFLNIQPEYEDCARLARELNLPLQQVQQMVLKVWSAKRKSSTNNR
jgi:uncharacterized protein (TIGR00299 family) protein